MDSRFRDFQAFLAAARQLKKLPELDDLLRDFVPNLGVDYFAIAAISGPRTHSNIFQMNSYPQAWMETMLARDYRERDPILAACGTTALGFVWSDVTQLIELTNAQKEYLKVAACAGMGEGFTVPIHIPGEPLGTANFCVAAGKEFPHSSIPLIQYTGCFVFEYARRLSRQHLKVKPKKIGPASLTGRQHDCVILAARGKSDWEAGQILGISANTVHKHIEAAKVRYGVTTRMQLVVQSLYDAHLSLEELVS